MFWFCFAVCVSIYLSLSVILSVPAFVKIKEKEERDL